MNLPSTKADATEVFKELKSLQWIDAGTAAIFIDFTVYNPNVNLFCQIQLAAEFPQFGKRICYTSEAMLYL